MLFAFAVVGWLLARSKATLATENEKAANDRLRLSTLRQVCRAWAEVISPRREDQRKIAERRWSSLIKTDNVREIFARDVNLPQLESCVQIGRASCRESE